MKQRATGPRPDFGRDPVVLLVSGLVGTVMLVGLGFAATTFWQSVGDSVSTPGPSASDRRPPPPQSSTGPSLSEPMTVKIPGIEVSSSLEKLRLNSDGTLGVPEDFQRAGWWVDGTHPGHPGPAIVVGHVDSYTGPAVFYRLRELQAGATVDIQLADGTVVRFVVERVQRFSKDEFPTDGVYGPTKGPTLRLITCGGDFDKRTKSYEDNVVVFASQA
jgi:hypothetical protein